MNGAEQDWCVYYTPEPFEKWTGIPDTPEAREQAKKQGAMFFTWAAHQGHLDNGKEPLRRGDLWFDFDNKENPEKAFEEANKATAYLEEVYGVDPHQIKIQLSGSKGVHLTVSSIILGATPGPNLHFEYKKIASKIKADLDLKTLDMSIYAGGMGGMMRIANVQRDNGRYAVPVMLSELRGLPAEELISFTEQPRHLDPDEQPEEPEESPLLKEFFFKCREEVQQELEAVKNHKPVGQDALKNLEGPPDCITALVACEHSTDKINFNKLALNLANYCVDAGISLEEAESLVEPLIEGYQSQSYPARDKRIKHFRSMYLYVQGNTSYGFSCSCIKGLGLPGSAFECSRCQVNLERKLSKAEFEKLINETDDNDKLLKDIHRQITDAGLLASEVEILRKLIKTKTKCTIASLREDAKQWEKSESELQLDYANAVISGLGQENIITDLAGTRIWRGKGYWEEAGPMLIKQICHQVMPDKHIIKAKVDSVYDLVKTRSFKQDHTWNQDVSAINCLNGELHWDGETFVLRPHHRESFRTTQLNAHYDPDACAPKFEEFMNWLVAKDGDEGPQKKELILQIMGYCLLSHAMFEKIFFFYGSGSNGKSIIIELIRHLLGAGNHSAIPPSQLGDQFSRAQLHNKLANLVTEIRTNEKLSNEYVKQIASGETISASHKFAHPFNFEPFCTLVYSTNHLPACDDTSEAMKRRLTIIEFTNKVSDKDRIIGYSKELMKEASGILNIIFKSLSKIMENGQFTVPESCLNLQREWFLQENHVADFLEEECETEGDNLFITANHLYQAYLKWTDMNGVKKTYSKKKFGMQLRTQGVESKRDTKHEHRGYSLRLKHTYSALCQQGVDAETGLPANQEV